MLDTIESYCLLIVKLDPSATERTATTFLQNIEINWSDVTTLENAMRSKESHFGVSGRWLYVTMKEPGAFLNPSGDNQKLILQCFNYSDMLFIHRDIDDSDGFAWFEDGDCLRCAHNKNGKMQSEIGQVSDIEQQFGNSLTQHQAYIEQLTAKKIDQHLNLNFSMTSYKCTLKTPS